MAKRAGIDLVGKHLNYLRFSLAESAAATYTELELDTNLSAERGVMMKIHSIEVYNEQLVNVLEVAQSSTEGIAWHVAREGKSIVTPLNDADVIAFQNTLLFRAATIGTDAGPLWFLQELVSKIDFALPIPYVKPSIFIAVQGTDATATAGIKGRIGYTLEEIDRTEFIELLVALQ